MCSCLDLASTILSSLGLTSEGSLFGTALGIVLAEAGLPNKQDLSVHVFSKGKHERRRKRIITLSPQVSNKFREMNGMNYDLCERFRWILTSSLRIAFKCVLYLSM